jgi:UDP-glucose 6-dehydrogenase
VLSNLLYDAAEKMGTNWADVKLIMDSDPMMSPYYNSPIHKSGRGAGGHCFIKDMAAFRTLYEAINSGDEKGIAVFKAMESKNLELLRKTGKDTGLVNGVYGAVGES